MDVDELLAKIVTTHGETQEVTRKLIKLLSLEHKNCGNHHGDPNIALSNILAKVQNVQDVLLKTYKVNYDILYDKTKSPPVIRPSIVIDSLDSSAMFEILERVDGYPTSTYSVTPKKKKKIQCTEPTHNGKCCITCNHSCRYCTQVNCKKNCQGNQTNYECRSCDERKYKCKQLSKVCCGQCTLCLRCGSLKDESAQCTNTKLVLGVDDAHLLRNLFGHLTKENCKQFLDGKCLLTGFKSKNEKELEQEMIRCVKRITCFLSCKQNFKFNACMTKEHSDNHVERIKTIWQNDMTFLNRRFTKELFRGFEDAKKVKEMSDELVSMMENVIEQLQRLTEGQKQIMKGQEEIKQEVKATREEVHNARDELQSGQSIIISEQQKTNSKMEALCSAVENMSVKEKDMAEDNSSIQQVIASASGELKEYYKKTYSKINQQHAVMRDHNESVTFVEHDDIIVEVTLRLENSPDNSPDFTLKDLISGDHPYSLICGDPGIGKTTLMKTLAYKWATDDLNLESGIKSFDFVFLLYCRNLNKYHDVSCVEDYLKKEYPAVFYLLTLEILQTNKCNVLLVIEGFEESSVCKELNEMSDSSRGDVSKQCNAMYDLMNPDNQELPFYRIITSRSFSKQDILRHFNRGSVPITQIKLIGFSSKEQIEKYIENYFSRDCEAASSLKDKLSQSEHLAGLAKSPTFCWAICSLYKENKSYSFPQTLTGINASLVLIFLRTHGLKKIAIDLQDVIEKEQTLICQLAKIAYLSLSAGRVVFGLSDIDRTVPEKFEDVLKRSGLIEFHSGGDMNKRCYQFLHLSIHEFLAVLHIFMRRKFLQKMESQDYASIFMLPSSLQFLAGLMGGCLPHSKSHEFVQLFSLLRKKGFVPQNCKELIEKSTNFIERFSSLYHEMLFEFENTIGLLPSANVLSLPPRTEYERCCMYYLLDYVRIHNNQVFPFRTITIDFFTFIPVLFGEVMQYIQQIESLVVLRCFPGLLNTVLGYIYTNVEQLTLPHCGISEEDWKGFANQVMKEYHRGCLRLKWLLIKDNFCKNHRALLPKYVFKIAPMLLRMDADFDKTRLKLIACDRPFQPKLEYLTAVVRSEDEFDELLIVTPRLKLKSMEVSFYKDCVHKSQNVKNNISSEINEEDRTIHLVLETSVDSVCQLCSLEIEKLEMRRHFKYSYKGIEPLMSFLHQEEIHQVKKSVQLSFLVPKKALGVRLVYKFYTSN